MSSPPPPDDHVLQDASTARRPGVILQIIGALGSLGATSALLRRLRDRNGSPEQPQPADVLLRSTLDGLTHAVVALDGDGRVILANAACARVLGLTERELLGHQPLHPSLRWTDGRGAALPAHDNPILSAARERRAAEAHLRFTGMDGGAATDVMVRISPTRSAGQSPAAVVTFEDITAAEHRRRADAAHATMEQHRSLYDDLTGLPNRPMLLDRIAHARERAWRGATATAMLVIDLDGFKAINEILGHEAGDEVLVQVAVRLKSAMRATDTPCRIGSDDFVALCEDIDLADTAAQIETITSRVISALDGPYLTSAGTTTVGASVGVAVAAHPEEVNPGLIDEAELALAAVKARREAADADLPQVLSHEPRALPPVEQAISVVLVDPDDAMRLLTRRVLHGSSHGFRVIGEATGGRDAVERIAELEPDLVVSELTLDDMAISDLIREVRAGRPGQRFLLWAAPQEGSLPAHGGSLGVPWLDKGQIDALTDAALEAAAAKLEGA